MVLPWRRLCCSRQADSGDAVDRTLEEKCLVPAKASGVMTSDELSDSLPVELSDSQPVDLSDSQPVETLAPRLRGRIVTTGRVGDIVSSDPSDAECSYKIVFSDGIQPLSDWFSEDSVELCGGPFKMTVSWPSYDFLIGDLHPSDTLGDLYKRVEAELGLHAGHLCLSLSGGVPLSNRKCKLGLLGIGEGAVVKCSFVHFDRDSVWLESKSHRAYIDGEQKTHTVAALMYANKGGAGQLLLWAGLVNGSAGPSLSADGFELCVPSLPSSNGRGGEVDAMEDAKNMNISYLVEKAESQAYTCLQEQFRRLFGESEKWPALFGPISRKFDASAEDNKRVSLQLMPKLMGA